MRTTLDTLLARGKSVGERAGHRVAGEDVVQRLLARQVVRGRPGGAARREDAEVDLRQAEQRGLVGDRPDPGRATPGDRDR